MTHPVAGPGVAARGAYVAGVRATGRPSVLRAGIVPARALRVACAVATALAAPAIARADGLYVAMGGSAAAAGAQRRGDPERLAAALRASGRPMRLVDLTAPGVTVHAVLDRQLARAVALRPALVTIAVGPADVAATTSLADFSRDLQTVVDLLRRNHATVVLSAIPVAARLGAPPGPASELRVDAFDWAVRLKAEENRVALADVRAREGAAARSWEAAVLAEAEAALPGGRPAPPPRPPAPPPAPAPPSVPDRVAEGARLPGPAPSPVPAG